MHMTTILFRALPVKRAAVPGREHDGAPRHLPWAEPLGIRRVGEGGLGQRLGQHRRRLLGVGCDQVDHILRGERQAEA